MPGHINMSDLRRWAIVLPILAVSSWLAMLGALFGSWYTSGEPRYVSEEETQNIAFISDIGAQSLKPVFITCTSLAMGTYIPTVVLYFYYMSTAKSFSTTPLSSPGFSLSSSSSLSSRYSVSSLTRADSLPSMYSITRAATRALSARHHRRPRVDGILVQVTIPSLSVVLSLIGATSLILLTIFDTARYNKAHQLLLPTSIGAHLLGCTILCIWTILYLRQYRRYHREQQRRSHLDYPIAPNHNTSFNSFNSLHYTHHPSGAEIYSGDKEFSLDLYTAHHQRRHRHDTKSPPGMSISSLIVKSVIVAFEFGLAILFAVTAWCFKTYDMAAVMEWIVVLMFAGYMLCMVMDMWVLGGMVTLPSSPSLSCADGGDGNIRTGADKWKMGVGYV